MNLTERDSSITDRDKVMVEELEEVIEVNQDPDQVQKLMEGNCKVSL